MDARGPICQALVGFAFGTQVDEVRIVVSVNEVIRDDLELLGNIVAKMGFGVTMKKFFKDQGLVTCPHCQKRFNALAGESVPKSGDINFCFECTKVSIIEVDGSGIISLRLPVTDAEKRDCAQAWAELLAGGPR